MHRTPCLRSNVEWDVQTSGSVSSKNGGELSQGCRTFSTENGGVKTRRGVARTCRLSRESKARWLMTYWLARLTSRNTRKVGISNVSRPCSMQAMMMSALTDSQCRVDPRTYLPRHWKTPQRLSYLIHPSRTRYTHSQCSLFHH